MSEKGYDNFLVGLVAGLLAPIACLYIYLTASFPQSNFIAQINKFITRGVIAHVISLSVIINLLLFFIFIWTHRDRSARGVLGATIVYALFIMFIKLAT